MISRRELVGGAVTLLAAPRVATAQQAGKIWRIGALSAGVSFREEALRRGLRDLGYVEQQHFVIESVNAGSPRERAAELVRRKVDVIVAAPSEAIRAAQQATPTIPIIMAFSGDPVGAGLVASLARPGGNTTGLSSIAPELARKRLEFIKAVVPELSRVALLGTEATLKRIVSEMRTAGDALRVQISPITVRGSRDLDEAFVTMKQLQAGGVIVDLLHDHRRRIAELALHHRLPTISALDEFATAGGLMTYGPNYPELFYRAAWYLDRIFKGMRPGDLPIEEPSKFDFVINLKTAKALGLTIPSSLLLRADQIIE